MNLPDKIKPTFRRITDKVIIAADLSLEAKTINQLIDYLAEVNKKADLVDISQADVNESEQK